MNPLLSPYSLSLAAPLSNRTSTKPRAKCTSLSSARAPTRKPAASSLKPKPYAPLSPLSLSKLHSAPPPPPLDARRTLPPRLQAVQEDLCPLRPHQGLPPSLPPSSSPPILLPLTRPFLPPTQPSVARSLDLQDPRHQVRSHFRQSRRAILALRHGPRPVPRGPVLRLVGL